MAKYELPESIHNHGLFQDYYLGSRVAPDLVAGEDEGSASEQHAALERIEQLWKSWKSRLPESEDNVGDFVKLVCEALGMVHSGQSKVARAGASSQRADITLFRDEAAAARFAKAKQSDVASQRYKEALAVVEVEHLGAALDRQAEDNTNPSHQIVQYLTYTTLPWGLLTDGARWRLYRRFDPPRSDVFFEVDLQAILEMLSRAERREAFKWFYAFFSRSAFDGEPGKTFLDGVFAGSLRQAVEVQATLRTQAFQVVEALAQGIAAAEDQPLANLDLPHVYQQAIVILYRLLFIKFAEDREILPVGNPVYQQMYGFSKLQDDLLAKLDETPGMLCDGPNDTHYWDRLIRFFKAINSGQQSAGISPYNGGLFKPEHLGQVAVPDRHLAQAIDRLARVEDPGGHARLRVSYRELEVRHLGSIYEGLLEQHLERAGAELQLVTAEGGRASERHATGSYYTPDFIVDYIVKATLDPMCTGQPAEKIEQVKILDPAMGSGHFLVSALDRLAQHHARAIKQAKTRHRAKETEAEYEARTAPQPEEVMESRRLLVDRCLYGVDLNPLAVELAKLAVWLATLAPDRPLSFLDHHLRTGNSLVGARMADLRLGEEGGKARRRTKKQAVAPEQLSMLEFDSFRQALSTAVDVMWLIEGIEGKSLAEVQQQEQMYGQLRQDLTGRYGRLADLTTSTHFGLAVEAGAEEWRMLVGQAAGRALGELPKFVEWLDDAARLAGDQHFFHWELEFPEVFFDRHGQPKGDAAGFDVVIGNPPYVRQELLAPFKDYFKATYSQVYDGTADLFVYFMSQGVQLLRAGGRMCYIVANKWLRAGYGEGLRGHLAQAAELDQIIDFGHAPIFEGADTFPCIVVFRRPGDTAVNPQQGQASVCQVPREVLHEADLGEYVSVHSYTVPRARFDRNPWSLERGDVDDLIAKIRQAGVPLSEFIGGITSYRGVLTGLNDAFLIDTATKERIIQSHRHSADLIRPYLRGQDIKRWAPEWAGLWIILLKSSENHSWPWSAAEGDAAEKLFAHTYPALYEHLKPMEAALRKRQDKGRFWWELRSCAYYAQFDRPKIVYQEIQFHPAYGYDAEGRLANNKVFLLGSADRYLLAVLNSPLMWWHNWRYLPHMKDEALTPKGELMETLPIARPTDTLRAQVEPAVDRLVATTRERQVAIADLLFWLRTEFGVTEPGQQLAAFTPLDEEAFVREVGKRRPRSSSRLSPAALRTLRTTHAEYASRLRGLESEVEQLERLLADLVNSAYGLTPEEVALLWHTAPPRMPGSPR